MVRFWVTRFRAWPCVQPHWYGKEGLLERGPGPSDGTLEWPFSRIPKWPRSWQVGGTFAGSSKELGKCCWPPSIHHPRVMSGFRKMLVFLKKKTKTSNFYSERPQGYRGKHYPYGKIQVRWQGLVPWCRVKPVDHSQNVFLNV